VEEEGIIVELKGKLAKVAIDPKFACAHCAARGACIQSGEMVYTEAVNLMGAQVGDLVRVELPTRTVYRSTLLLFFMPLVWFALGFGFARWTGLSQGVSILAGLALFGVWFSLLKRIDRNRSPWGARPVIKSLISRRGVNKNGRRKDEPSQG